ncbi:SDR family NAD(P)-dependent oxidoreductase [Sphingomonas sp. SRS2]|uniref:SDR family NAD(P)-dependent oxidoreductase n=1 Tax=Sphingomonas sp. SRS2 TaxID=133190 RepID=UPI0006184E47|nr:SDR family oxidoreductase [Sphingomonas sp. SRS2]KKC25206.1 short-chain dehydrogenase [Sphingomonas sp. SRS2]
MSAASLAGRIALVTGAAGGIGAATADALVARGATVVLSDINIDALETTMARFRGGPHRALKLDVTAEADWETATEEVRATFGKLDILVNNAGWGDRRLIFETSFDQWKKLLAINLDSVFLGTRHMMPLLEASGDAAIVNVSSIRGLVVGVGFGPYSAAKAGVHIFSKATAVECAATGRKVRVNSVHPGFVATPIMLDMVGEAGIAERCRDVPQGRFALPEEIATAICFLASSDASFVNGTELIVDGGFTAI